MTKAAVAVAAAAFVALCAVATIFSRQIIFTSSIILTKAAATTAMTIDKQPARNATFQNAAFRANPVGSGISPCCASSAFFT